MVRVNDWLHTDKVDRVGRGMRVLVQRPDWQYCISNDRLEMVQLGNEIGLEV